jgi:acetyl esterase/lipase
LLRWILDRRRSLVRWDAPVESFRAMMARQERHFRPPRDVAIRPATVGGVPCEWLTPPGADDRAVILYLHGGAWTLGWTAIHRRMVAHLARAAGCRVLAVDYRLAPEHPFPAALDDCLAAYRALRADGTPPGSIVVAGDSAGGTLALGVLIALRDAGEPPPAAAACIGAATDLAGTGATFETARDPIVTPAFVRRMRALYIGAHDIRSPLISPLYADLRGLPPLLIQAGGDEMLLSDSERLAEAARAAGVDATLEIWPRMWHVWHLFAPTLPEARRAIAAVAAFARRHLGLDA